MTTEALRAEVARLEAELASRRAALAAERAALLTHTSERIASTARALAAVRRRRARAEAWARFQRRFPLLHVGALCGTLVLVGTPPLFVTLGGDPCTGLVSGALLWLLWLLP